MCGGRACGRADGASTWRRRRSWCCVDGWRAGGVAEAPRVSLAQAVATSCSLPGWFAPERIGQHRYIDGGIRSVTSADLLAGSPPDRAYVLAPLAGVAAGFSRTPWEWAGRGVRRILAGAVSREIGILRAAGTEVTLLTPGPEDLAAMGWNLMNPAHRDKVLLTSLQTSARVPRQRAA